MSAAEFDPDARAEFLAAVAYYEECQAGLGRHFRATVESALEHIVEMPLRFRVLHTPFRRCLVPNFPIQPNLLHRAKIHLDYCCGPRATKTRVLARSS